MSSGTMDEEEAMMPTQQPHLYLIFDDWKHGYSFRKVDLPSRGAPDLVPEGIARGGTTSLPPPFFRLQARRGVSYYFTASGSKIWSMHLYEEGKSSLDSGGSCFDVRAQTFAFVPRHADQPKPVYFPIGNKLLTLGRLSIQSLDIGVRKRRPMSWSEPLDVPVDSMDVISHAVFPDGRTIFVSVGFLPVECTYSFHLSGDGSGSLSMCKHQGDWVLPFHVRGHFDDKLNTWVGLSLYREKLGHICSCDLASAAATSSQQRRRPDVKYTRDYLFTTDPEERHVGATLVYMGHGSKFCLVECITNVFRDRYYQGPYSFEKEINTEQEERAGVYMLRLTTFSLEYNSDGELTTGHKWVRYYDMPEKCF